MKLEQTTKTQARLTTPPLTFDFYTFTYSRSRKTKYFLRRLPFALPALLNPLWAWLRECLPEDADQALVGVLHTAAASNVDVVRHYRQGYRTALVTLALAFGISMEIPDRKPALIEAVPVRWAGSLYP